jgi:PII-like signaling protein
MITAIGSGERIARVVPELGGLLRDPTITVEQVQLCKRNGRLLDYPRPISHVDADGIPMWQKLAVYTSAGDQYEGEPVHRALVRRLRAGDTRGVTVLGGFWGFHGARRPGGDSIWRLGRDVPMCTVVVDTPQRLVRAFAAVDEVTTEHGLVTIEIVPALIASTGGPARPPTLGHRPPDDRARQGRSIARWNTPRSAGQGTLQ